MLIKKHFLKKPGMQVKRFLTRRNFGHQEKKPGIQVRFSTLEATYSEEKMEKNKFAVVYIWRNAIYILLFAAD